MEQRFFTLDDLSHMPAPQWMIEGLFERGSLVMLAGPSYSFKSFLLLDWLLSMASGRKWHGRPTQTAKIVYALGEGKSGLMKRVQAWVNHNKPSREELSRLQENFRVTFDVVQLASKASTDNLLADLEKAQFKPDFIAIDTFARSMVGLDENDAKDTGLWVESADRLRQLGYGVIFVHHTKKNTEFGVTYRGSTAIIGAMDTALTMVRNGDACTLTVTKQKDHDEGKPIRFIRTLVPVSKTESSCVLVPLAPVVEAMQGVGTPKGEADLIVETLRCDPNYPTNAAKIREIARRLNCSEAAAKARFYRPGDGSQVVSVGELHATQP